MLLDLHSTLNGIDHTGKLSQNVVSRRIHDPAMMLLDVAGNDLAVSRESADGSLLILTHEPTVALNISAENSSELAFKALLSHGSTPA